MQTWYRQQIASLTGRCVYLSLGPDALCKGLLLTKPKSQSTTFYQVKQMSSRPLVASMGPLSRLVAHSVGSCGDSTILHTLVDDLHGFARTLTVQWRQNKLSEVDLAEESLYLQQESLETTLPLLWHILKTAMFATVVVLGAAVGRVLGDRELAAEGSESRLLIFEYSVSVH